MSFPAINPANIAGAKAYTVGAAYIKLPSYNRASDRPSPEGNRAIPMSFNFAANTAWQVFFSNSPNASMSQLASLYVDATNCEFDVNIFFPDTGYIRRIEQGGGALIPVISGLSPNQLPSFYVLLDSSGVVDANSTVNVQALNFFITDADASSSDIGKNISYGFSSFFIPQPNFTQSTNFTIQINATAAPFTGTTVLIPNKQWFITGININWAAAGPSTSMVGNIQLLDQGSGKTVGNYVLNAPNDTVSAMLIADQAGLNIISAGGGNLVAVLSALTTPENITYTININICGGILVT